MIKTYDQNGVPVYLEKSNIIKVTYALEDGFLYTKIFFKVGVPLLSFEPIEGFVNKIRDGEPLEVDMSTLFRNMEKAGMTITSCGLPVDELNGALIITPKYGETAGDVFKGIVIAYEDEVVKYIRGYKEYKASGF